MCAFYGLIASEVTRVRRNCVGPYVCSCVRERACACARVDWRTYVYEEKTVAYTNA